MTILVADTSGLVSLGIAADLETDPFTLCLDAYDVRIPQTVQEELGETAGYDDPHGNAAQAILDRLADARIESVALDANFPLDDGENAPVSLANDCDGALVLCDEFNKLGLIHASLATARLVTTPTLLALFARQGRLDTETAKQCLETISHARSWDPNGYVERAHSLFE